MKKRLLALVLGGMMMLSTLAGCGSNDAGAGNDVSKPGGSASAETPPAAGAAEEYEITTICMALNSDYWHMVEAGAKLAGKELGVKVNVIGPNAESDSATQINMVEDAVNNKVDAIVLAPNEPTSLVSAAQTVKAAGIPLVVIDSMLNTEDESLYACFVGTGNIAAGGHGGDFIASQLNTGDKVGIIRGLVGQTVHDQRADGAQEAMEKAGLQVISIQPADSDRGKAVNVAENMLQANPDIKAFYATNDDMALGAYQAVAAAGLKDVVVVGFDGTFNAMDSILKGEMSASVAQLPVEEGYQGVVNAVKLLKGESVEKNQALDVVVLNKNNVADFRKTLEAKIAESGVKLGG